MGDKNFGMLETIAEVYPIPKYQRCIIHFYCNVFQLFQ
ncbi:transposase [Anaerovibrio sp. RM50]